MSRRRKDSARAAAAMRDSKAGQSWLDHLLFWRKKKTAQTAKQRRARHARWALHLGTGLLIALSLALATPAEAKKKREGQQQTVRVKHQSTGSGETRAERERRLTRECRGRPNAGACLGFAS